MRVARSVGVREVRIEDDPDPEAGAGEVVCRVLACGVCGSDVLDAWVARKVPAVLGHELAAEVEQLGDARDGTLAAGVVCGLLFGVEFLLIYRGLIYTAASRATLFIYLAPFFVALGSRWLFPGDRFGLLQWSGLAMAFVGMMVAFGVPAPASSPPGALCAPPRLPARGPALPRSPSPTDCAPARRAAAPRGPAHGPAAAVHGASPGCTAPGQSRGSSHR